MQAPIGPAGIDVEQYKRQAKELLKSARLESDTALARIRAHHPEWSTSAKSPDVAGLKLADAQIVLARENGFASWPRFVEYLHFRNAVVALDAGNLERLESIIDSHPRVLGYECRTGEWYEEGYFAGATLLMHVAGNPIRGPLPANIVSIAKLLIERHLTAEMVHRTIGLLLSSKQASEAGVALSLVFLVSRAGKRFDVTFKVRSRDVLTAPLLNHAPGTAHELIRLGAPMSLGHAAALGKLDAMRSMLEQEVEQASLDEALIFACFRDQRDAAALLVERGARGDALIAPGGVTPRTALHEAASRGYAEIVELLLSAGVSAQVLDTQFNGTAAGWADAGGFPDLAHRLRATNP